MKPASRSRGTSILALVAAWALSGCPSNRAGGGAGAGGVGGEAGGGAGEGGGAAGEGPGAGLGGMGAQDSCAPLGLGGVGGVPGATGGNDPSNPCSRDSSAQACCSSFETKDTATTAALGCTAGPIAGSWCDWIDSAKTFPRCAPELAALFDCYDAQPKSAFMCKSSTVVIVDPCCRAELHAYSYCAYPP